MHGQNLYVDMSIMWRRMTAINQRHLQPGTVAGATQLQLQWGKSANTLCYRGYGYRHAHPVSTSSGSGSQWDTSTHPLAAHGHESPMPESEHCHSPLPPPPSLQSISADESGWNPSITNPASHSKTRSSPSFADVVRSAGATDAWATHFGAEHSTGERRCGRRNRAAPNKRSSTPSPRTSSEPRLCSCEAVRTAIARARCRCLKPAAAAALPSRPGSRTLRPHAEGQHTCRSRLPRRWPMGGISTTACACGGMRRHRGAAGR
jgi:hypothetical protein